MLMLMSHNHHHMRRDNLRIAILLNLSFSVFEFIFGAILNSKMILADALHDLGDAITLASMLLVDFLSKKKPTKKYNYGFRRLSVLAAVVSAVLILVGSYQLARYVYFEFTRPHYHPYVKINELIVVSVVGVLVNLISARRMHGAKSLMDKAVFAHLLEDLLGWGITLLSSILMWMTGWHQIDRIMSLVMLILVSWNAIEVVVKSVKVLMNAAPSAREFEGLEREILAVDGVQKIENCHLWSLDGEQNVFTARILVSKNADAGELRKVISKIVAKYGVVDSTVEIIEK